ncbi:TPA: hypothetical protein RTG63_001672 [Campylobacter jejuni]|nr:hypothetical protein [Campylobacter jejuni]
MRYYTLLIDNQPIAKLNSKNPIAPRLVFNLGNYGDIAYSKPSSITLYNLPTSFFTNIDKFRNKIVHLMGGISSEGFSKVQGLTSTQTDTLYLGKVDNIVTSWQGRETIVTFLINSIGKVNNAKFVTQIDRGDRVADKVKQLIDKYLEGKNYSVKIDTSATNITANSLATVPLKPTKDTIEGLRYFNSVLTKFGLNLAVSGQNLTIRKIDDFSISKGEITILAEELLTQPVAEAIDLVKIEIALNPGIMLFSKIKLPPNIPLAPSEDLSSAGIGQLIRTDVKGNLIMKGTYVVINVIHSGDSRNTDVSSWSTILLCQRQS